MKKFVFPMIIIFSTLAVASTCARPGFSQAAKGFLNSASRFTVLAMVGSLGLAKHLMYKEVAKLDPKQTPEDRVKTKDVLVAGRVEMSTGGQIWVIEEIESFLAREKEYGRKTIVLDFFDSYPPEFRGYLVSAITNALRATNDLNVGLIVFSQKPNALENFPMEMSVSSSSIRNWPPQIQRVNLQN